MSALHLDPAERNAAQPKPLSAILLVAMLAVVAVSGLCSIPALSGAFPQQPPRFAQCAEIATGTARLACYDRAGQAALSAPAKGATAPALGR